MELLAALEAAGQDTRQLALPTRAPRAAAGPPVRAALAGPPRSGGPRGPVSMPPEQAMQENRPPPPSNHNMAAALTAVKQEPQAAEVGTRTFVGPSCSFHNFDRFQISECVHTTTVLLACQASVKWRRGFCCHEC